jgi:hypothetical protein
VMHPRPPDIPAEKYIDWPHVLVVGFKEMPAVTCSVIEALGGELLLEQASAVAEVEEGTNAGGGLERRGDDQPLCSFCGKAQGQVKRLVAGPGVFICNECVDLANEIID